MLHAKTRQVNIRGDARGAINQVFVVYAGEPLKPSVDNYYWTGLSNLLDGDLSVATTSIICRRRRLKL